MVAISVHIPIIHETYDFRYNEKSFISDVVNDTLELVSEKEGLGISKLENLVLCNSCNGMILDSNQTLEDYGVKNGDYLLII